MDDATLLPVDIITENIDVPDQMRQLAQALKDPSLHHEEVQRHLEYLVQVIGYF